LLDGLIRRPPCAPPGLDFREDLVVRKTLQGGLDLGFLPLVPKLVNVFDCLDEIPCRIDSRTVSLRSGSDITVICWGK
jgi:hypothetical protein